MTYDLYWVSVLGYIVITLIILIRERKYTHTTPKRRGVSSCLLCASLWRFMSSTSSGGCAWLMLYAPMPSTSFRRRCSTSWLSSPPCRGFAMCCAT